MGRYPYRVELLAPAGSREAFTGAVSAGADAVYLGGEQFGARAYADNFSTPEIIRALGEAHALGRKIYLTANVLTREDEMPALIRFVEELYEAGLDGVIVQDLGVLSALHDHCPGLPLHASTQMSVTSVEAVRYLRTLGVSRVVPARELSLQEIETLRKEDAAFVQSYNDASLRDRAGLVARYPVSENGNAPAGPASCGIPPIAPIEIEAFIHGAMCYSYSGRCLISSFLGGRSGNRGRCAGTCRLPYRILDEKGRPAGPDARKKEVWPLSMKDMCVLTILPELIDAGIHSFKIEGRMKKPVYAAGVTAIYRKYIDRCYAWMDAGRKTPWKVEEEDLDKLRSLYIRTALGTGYYHTKNGRNLVTIGKPGYAGTDTSLEEEIRRQFLGGLPGRPVTGRALFRIGEPARLQVWPADNDLHGKNAAGRSAEKPAQEPGAGEGNAETAVCIRGAVVQAASARPLDIGELDARLRKTGDSLFYFSDLEIDADENIFLPVSAVNALRREALQALFEKAAGRRKKESPEKQAPDNMDSPGTAVQKRGRAPESRITSGGQELWALVSSRDQMKAAAGADCACILIDGDFGPGPAGVPSRTHNGNNFAVKKKKTRFTRVLPPVFRVFNREAVRESIRTAGQDGFSGIMVRTLEELELAREMAYDGEIIADASLYAWNGRALAALAQSCDRMVCSLELSQKAILDALRAAPAGDGIMQKVILPVYGRIPVMETAGCVRKTENQCTGQDGFWYLEDRTGRKLPVRCRCGTCSNTIYNAVPLSLHQYGESALYRESPVRLCMFTTETGKEAGRILTFFTGLSPDLPDRRRRADLPFDEFTKGHYRTGAL